jgi:hypothetical protein
MEGLVLRTFRAAVAVMIAAAATTLAGAMPANAVSIDVVCVPPSSDVITFDPPLTLTPQTVDGTSFIQLGPCTSLTVPGLASGSSIQTFTAPDSTCEVLLGALPTEFTITWNTGQTSTITGNTVGVLEAGLLTVTLTGSVSSGLFAGHSVAGNQSGPATDLLLCRLGLGDVSSVYTVGTFTISSLTS